MRRYALVEAGGSKFMCGVADDWRNLVSIRKILTTDDPARTLAEVRAYFESQADPAHPFVAGGLASFGPIDLDADSPTYGVLRRTPKPGWDGVNVRTALGDVAPIIGLDTDVNAACLAESLWGAGSGRRTVAYATVGTGIGAGIVRDGVALQGSAHYEIGHIPIGRERAIDSFEGCCPYHGGCLEGLASGSAIRQRWGVSLDGLPADHVAYDLEATYLAQMCASLIYSFAPDVIVLGGGVMKVSGLLQKTRERTLRILGNYWTTAAGQGDLSGYIVAPELEFSGLWGALALAIAAERAVSVRNLLGS